MKCNWLGKPMEQAPPGRGFFYVVVHPLQSIDEKTQYALSSAAGLSALDIKVRARPNGYFMLCKSQDQADMEAVRQKLNKTGIHATLFDDATLYSVPPANAAHSVLFEDESIAFLNATGQPLMSVAIGDKFLMVRAKLSIEKGERHTMQFASDHVAVFREQSTEFVHLCVMFNMARPACVEISPADFNYGTVPGASLQAPFLRNFEMLVSQIRSVASVKPDFHYEYSSLPLPDRVDVQSRNRGFSTAPIPLYIGTGSVPPSGGGLAARRKSFTSTRELERFRSYARFRFIVEAFVNAESYGLKEENSRKY